MLINCLLRNYLHYNLYTQADKLVLKSTFPDQASNNEWARYYYYLGRIKAIQLEYSEAHKNLQISARKAPQNTATGFKQHVSKLAVTVDLLLGNIPARSTFLAADVTALAAASAFAAASPLAAAATRRCSPSSPLARRPPWQLFQV